MKDGVADEDDVSSMSPILDNWEGLKDGAAVNSKILGDCEGLLDELADSILGVGIAVRMTVGVRV